LNSLKICVLFLLLIIIIIIIIIIICIVEQQNSTLYRIHVVTVYVQPLLSSLSAGDCLMHRLRKDFLNRCTGQSAAESEYTNGCTYTITTWTSL